jgi:hypothetical protein
MVLVLLRLVQLVQMVQLVMVQLVMVQLVVVLLVHLFVLTVIPGLHPPCDGPLPHVHARLWLLLLLR